MTSSIDGGKEIRLHVCTMKLSWLRHLLDKSTRYILSFVRHISLIRHASSSRFTIGDPRRVQLRYLLLLPSPKNSLINVPNECNEAKEYYRETLFICQTKKKNRNSSRICLFSCIRSLLKLPPRNYC